MDSDINDLPTTSPHGSDFGNHAQILELASDPNAGRGTAAAHRQSRTESGRAYLLIGGTEQLAMILKGGGADVSMFWHRGGQELGDDDIEAAKTWLAEKVTKTLAA
jgi:hypothetical protein